MLAKQINEIKSKPNPMTPNRKYQGSTHIA